jgi:hypothetical protein
MAWHDPCQGCTLKHSCVKLHGGCTWCFAFSGCCPTHCCRLGRRPCRLIPAQAPCTFEDCMVRTGPPCLVALHCHRHSTDVLPDIHTLDKGNGMQRLAATVACPNGWQQLLSAAPAALACVAGACVLLVLLGGLVLLLAGTLQACCTSMQCLQRRVYTPAAVQEHAL